MNRIRSDVIGGLFWLAVGIFFAVGGILLRPGTLRNPGPGFLPLVMASLLICFSLFILIKGLVGSGSLLKALRWRRQAVMMLSVFLYGVVMEWVGFFFSTLALMFVLFGVLFQGKGRWPKVLFCAAVTALAGWLVFSVILKVPFPRARMTAIWR